LSNK